MLIPDLELIIERTAEGATTVGLRVELPSRRVELAERVPITITDAALLALANNPDVYGATLTAMVFAPALKEAWQRARGFAEGAGQSLRVRLDLEGDDALHAIRWELLRDPIDQSPLAYSERVRLSRFLGSASLADIQLAERPELRALVAVANPPTLGQGMAAVQVADEVARARQGLGDIVTSVLAGGETAASLPAVAAGLRDGAHLLYLVCHGALIEGQPFLWLEQESDEPYRPVPGADLVQTIAGLERRPLLVVLASCQGGGDTHQMLAAVGPQLARAGVGAVLAMQGNVPMELVARLVPRLFEELRRDGQVDRALAAARAALPAASEWWMPALWMAVRDGALWRAPAPPATAAPPGSAGPAFRVPYPPSPLFRGREAELAELAALLAHAGDGPARVIPAISGMAGIGKTQLASEFAYRHRDAFPGGVFWLNMSQPDGVAAQVAELGGPDGLNLPGWAQMSFNDRVAAVRRAWEQPERRLLVLDNLEEPQLLEAWQVLGGGTRELITTRRGVWAAASGVQPLRLPVLARPDAVRLLLAPRHGPQLEQALADSPTAQAAEAICEQVGDLPLALALAAAYLEQMPSLPLDGFRGQLEQKALEHLDLQGELEADLPTRCTESVAATIALSYARLDRAEPTDATALDLLARAAQLAPAPIPQRLLARLAGHSPDEELEATRADTPLRRLAAVGLIDLLPEGGAAVQRLVGAYTRAQDGATAASLAAAAQALADEVAPLDFYSHPQRGVPYLPHLTALTARESELEAEAAAALHGALAWLRHGQGNYAAARAHYERALAIAEQGLGSDHPRTAAALSDLGSLLLDQGEVAAGRAHYERAFAIRERLPEPNYADLTDTLNGLGRASHDQGDAASARAYYERALAIAEERLGPHHHETATLLHNLAVVLRDQGDTATARPLFERALAISEQIYGPDHPHTAVGLNTLGDLLHSLGESTAARPLFERALGIVERQRGSGHPILIESLRSLAWLLNDQGETEAARANLERAVAIAEQTYGSDDAYTADTLYYLANVLYEMNDYTAARTSYERALAIYTKLGDARAYDAAVTLDDLGELLFEMSDYTAARTHYERALKIFKKLGKDCILEEAATRQNLGDLLYAEKNYAAARTHYKRALAIHEQELGPDHLDTAKILYRMGSLLRDDGDHKAARPLFKRALAIYQQQLGDKDEQTVEARKNLASLDRA